MNAFELYIIFLKIALTIQVILILMKKQKRDGIVFITSELIFKISIGLFLIFFFILRNISGISWSDKMVISFSGVLLIYDAVYIDLPKALRYYNIDFSPYNLLGI